MGPRGEEPPVNETPRYMDAPGSFGATLVRRLLSCGWMVLLLLAPAAQALAQSGKGEAPDRPPCPVDRTSLARIIDRQGLATREMMHSRGLQPAPGEPELVTIDQRLAQIPDRVLVLLGEHEGRSCAWVWTAGRAGQPRQVMGVLLADTAPVQAMDLPSLGRLHLPGRSARTVTDIPPIASVTELLSRLQHRWASPALLNALAGARDIVMMPTGALAQLPWNALMMAARDFAPEAAPITLAATLGAAVSKDGLLDWSPIDAADQVLVVGNPDYRGSLPQLPGAETEARLVAKAFGVEPLLGRDATTQRVLESLKKADVAFLATHGFSHPQAGLEGGALALSDGRVNAREIQALKFEKMPLIVLSACETGLGQVHEAGTIGLARAFQIAGAFGVVMSLWSVDDEATQKLMLYFVEELQRAAPPQALMRAQGRLRLSHPDPRHWGAFNYFGAPIRFSR